ncbi:MAG: cytosolic protein [Pseudomonadota bacterium]
MSEKNLDSSKTNQDSAWKDILDAYFKECMVFFYPDLAKNIDWSAGYETWDKELQSITTDAMIGKRFVDKLVKVKSLEGDEQVILLHIEVQSRKEDEFPLRLFQYYYRLFDRYKKPILTLAILTDDNKSWCPINYQTVVWRRPVVYFNFETTKLLHYRGREQELAKTENPFGIVVLTHLAAIDTRSNAQDRYQIKFALTRRLFEKGHSRDYVINLYKMVDWILNLPKELESQFESKVRELEEEKKVSYITSIERNGEERGLQQGLQQGEQRRALAIAKNLLAKGMPLALVKEVTKLPDLELTELEKV